MSRLRRGWAGAKRRWTYRGLLVAIPLALVLVCASIAMALTTPGISPQIKATFASSNYHSLAIKPDGSLWAWGYNGDGALGDGSTKTQSSPVQVGSATDWATVAAGGSYSVAIKTDGSLWVWGDNQFGQLGLGDSQDRNTPNRLGTENNWVCVSATKVAVSYVQTGANAPLGLHTLALKTDGSLWGWGYSFCGQLGESGVVEEVRPIRIGSDNDWATASAGCGYSAALKSDGSLWAWGNNRLGQLGDGTTADKPYPTRIGTDTNWVRVSVGFDQSLALKSDGSLWAWGSGYTLGNGTGAQCKIPTRIGTDSDWVAIDASYNVSMAVKADGSLWMWGLFGYRPVPNQPGWFYLLNYTVPTKVGAVSDWTAVAAGNPRLALKGDGSLWGWSLPAMSAAAAAPIPVQIMTSIKAPGSYVPVGVTTTSTTASTTTTTAPPAPAFSDVPASNPYYAAISAMASKAIIGGYPDGTFGPDRLVLRKHFAKMIVGAMGLTTTEADWNDANPPFVDCGPDDPASLYPHDYIAVAKAHGLTSGKTANTFAPEANITRAQMVTMVVRAAQNSGTVLDPVEAGYTGIFKDYNDPNHGANVHLAEYNRLLQDLQISGDPAAWMAGNATRGEVAQVLWNLMRLRAGAGSGG